MANILQVPVPNGSAAVAWSSREAGVNSLLFINQDLNNTVWLGQVSNVTAGGPHSIPLAPNGTFSGDASSNWYVTGSAAGVQPLVVVPNGQAYFLGITQGLGNLVIPSVQSPNFVTGVSGWQIAKNGSAEFNNVTIRGGLVIGGTELKYNGVAAANNLIYSNSVAGGTDSFGNVYLAGEVTYEQVAAGQYQAMQILETGIAWFTATSEAGPWTSQTSIGFVYNPGTGYKAIAIANSTSAVEVDGAVSTVLAAVQPGTVVTKETWHTASLVNSWAGSGSATNGLFYRLTTENVVRIVGDLNSPGTASVITTLPTGYRPATSVNIEWNRYDDSGTAHATVDTSGNITMVTVVGAGKGLFVNAFVPLGAL